MKTWFKFYGQEYLSDPKMLSLDPTERAIWLTILCLASSSHEEGVIRYISLQKILQLTNVEYGGFYEKILDRFSDLGMITVDNEKDNLVIKVVNYEKRQQKTLTPYERVKNYRERQKISKKIASNDNEMITHDNADDNDRIEKNRIEKKRNDLPTEDLKEKKVKASPSLAKSLKEKYPNVFKAIILLFAFLLLPHLTFAKTVEVEYQVTIRGYQSPQAHASGTRAVGGTAPSSSPVRKKTTVPHGSQAKTANFSTALADLPSDQEWAVISKYKHAQVIAQIYKGESSYGKHDVCRERGGYNGFGYNEPSPLVHGPTCYSSFEEVVSLVNNWIEERVEKSKLTLAEANCLYITGSTRCRWNTSYKLQ